MKSEVFYKTMSKFYDLVDIIYFRNYKNSPRKVVLETIENGDSVLDLCTGTATNALKIAKAIQSTYHDFYALGNGSNWGVYI